jgi:hypothetical protein
LAILDYLILDDRIKKIIYFIDKNNILNFTKIKTNKNGLLYMNIWLNINSTNQIKTLQY